MSAESQDLERRQASLPTPKRPRKARTHLGRLSRGLLARFILFGVLCLVIMLAMGIYEVVRQVRETQSRQQQIAVWAAHSFDSWFLDARNNLQAAAAYPDLLDRSAQEQDAQLRQALLRSPSFRYVSLVDARPAHYGLELRRLQQGDTVGISSGARQTGADWFSKATLYGYQVSTVDYSSGAPVVIMALPVISDTLTVGLIAAEVDLSSAYATLRQFGEPSQGNYVYVANLQGWPLLHTLDSKDRPLVSRESRMDVQGLLAGVQGQTMPMFYSGLNRAGGQGELVMGGYQRIVQTNWVVVAEQPVSWLLRRFLPLALVVVGFLLASALAAAGIGISISRRVGQPIVRLKEGAQRIGAGNLDHRIILPGYDELSSLAEEFNRMAGNLHISLARQEAWSHELEERVKERTVELSQALEQLQEESAAREDLLRTIRQISSPVIPVMEGIIVLPIVGALDSERAQRVMDDLLAGIERERARVVIVDITGLAVVDTAVANALLQSARAARLLGAEPILVGITPEVAETIVQLGVEMETLHTAATLQEGLRRALGFLRRKVISS